MVLSLATACDSSAVQPRELRRMRSTPPFTERRMASEFPANAADLFTEDEFVAVLLLLTPDQAEARTLARMMRDPSLTTSYDGEAGEEWFFTLLALTSDDSAVRVGHLRGQTPEQALAWKAEFLEVHGDPSTWEIERVHEDEIAPDE